MRHRWFAHLRCPGSAPHTPAKTTRGADAHPVAPNVRTRGGGASRSAQTSCASRSREAGAAATAQAGLGATRQSEGLLRVRGRARLRTSGPDPSGRSQAIDPLRGKAVRAPLRGGGASAPRSPVCRSGGRHRRDSIRRRVFVVRRDRAIHSLLSYVDSNVSVTHPNRRLGF